jgi:hypothetical protein
MKNWENIAVGDSIFSKDGDEAKVLEVFASGKTFCRSEWKCTGSDWETEVWGFTHIDQAIRYNWTLEEKKKDRVQEFEEWLDDIFGISDGARNVIIAKVKELFGSNSA